MFRASPNLQGYNIPGLMKKLIINLFADDTLLYLSKEDRYTDVQPILDGWCEASGAHFNTDKTEYIPIGTEEHRTEVVTTRRLTANDRALPATARIAKDGTAVRYLGGYVGNDIDDTIPWGPVLDKVSKKLKQWSHFHPSLRGKKAIVQMFVGGCTQYLAKVQGMPKPVEKALVKLIRNFLWTEDVKRAPIEISHLYQQTAKGGLDLLDIPSRNKAIEITWLRSYLDLTDKRPTWAFAADVLIAKISEAHNIAKLNTFLQTWSVPTRGKNAATLPKGVIRMLDTAKTYNLNFACLKLSDSLKRQLPAWFH
ncbi:hypothetical protein FA95DRAFT_1633182, partial [Auriscalpium vulgare]